MLHANAKRSRLDTQGEMPLLWHGQTVLQNGGDAGLPVAEDQGWEVQNQLMFKGQKRSKRSKVGLDAATAGALMALVKSVRTQIAIRILKVAAALCSLALVVAPWPLADGQPQRRV
jgi:hypothetical protein